MSVRAITEALWPARPSRARSRTRHSRTAGVALAATALLAGAAAPALASPAPSRPAAATASTAGISSLPVSFEVRNVNRSKVACHADGRTYTVRGHLVGPSAALRNHSAHAATLYLHGLGFGEFFWDFSAVAGYDYAADQARAGQVSVVVDRLGYGASSKVPGRAICVGSRADIAHQMVLDLRNGHYTVGGASAPRFSTVVLAGHSYGAQIAQVEAYSFGGINGLVLIGYSDRVQSITAAFALYYATTTCQTTAGAPGGTGIRRAFYTPFGSPSNAAMALFHDTAPAVLKAALLKISIDPCGDDLSFAAAVKVDLANVGHIRVPVLIVEGGADAFFPPPAGADQASLLTGAKSVTVATVPGSGHAITLSRHHRVLETAVLGFLRTNVHAG